MDALHRPRCDTVPAWAQLQAQYAASGAALDLRAAFAADPGSFASFSQDAPYVFADLSKNRIDVTTQSLLFDLARQTGVEVLRDAMFAGAKINTTEDRAVMHFLLRKSASTLANTAPEAIKNDLIEVHATLDAMLAFAETTRAA